MRRIAPLVVAVIAAATLTACADDPSATPSKPDADACRSALSRQLDGSVNDSKDAREGYQPRACQGLDRDTVAKIAEELVADGDHVSASALPSASARKKASDQSAASPSASSRVARKVSSAKRSPQGTVGNTTDETAPEEDTVSEVPAAEPALADAPTDDPTESDPPPVFETIPPKPQCPDGGCP